MENTEFLSLFVHKVEEMRTAQKHFFKTKQSNFLEESRKLEAEVDKQIKYYKGEIKPAQNQGRLEI